MLKKRLSPPIPIPTSLSAFRGRIMRVQMRAMLGSSVLAVAIAALFVLPPHLLPSEGRDGWALALPRAAVGTVEVRTAVGRMAAERPSRELASVPALWASTHRCGGRLSPTAYRAQWRRCRG